MVRVFGTLFIPALGQFPLIIEKALTTLVEHNPDQ